MFVSTFVEFPNSRFSRLGETLLLAFKEQFDPSENSGRMVWKMLVSFGNLESGSGHEWKD